MALMTIARHQSRRSGWNGVTLNHVSMSKVQEHDAGVDQTLSMTTGVVSSAVST